MAKLILEPVMKQKSALTSLSVSAAAIAAVLALSVAPVSLTTSDAIAADSPQSAPAAKKKVKKTTRKLTRKKVAKKKSLRKKAKKKRRAAPPRRKSNFNSGSVDPAIIEPHSPSRFSYLTLASAQIKSGDYRTAIVTLNGLKRPNDANVLNLLGFSHRKLGLVDVGLRYYHAALEANPEHHGAHEYLGEAYLQKDDLAKAEVILKKLGGLCGTDCKHYKELAKAIDAFKMKRVL